MGWKDLPKPKPPAEGVWHEALIGGGVRDWSMACGAFRAEIRRVGEGDYYLSINRRPISHGPALADMMRLAEETILRRVEAVLPAYEVIRARLACRPPG